MLNVSLAELAAVVQGRLDFAADPSAAVVGPVVLDSREITPGSVFAAFAGEHADGHSFAGTAVEQGAVCVLASRPVGVPAVLVEDVGAGLGVLAAWQARRMAGVTRIGVTGSSGKTSTKDLLAQVLARLGPVWATRGSRNNELGVPLTVLSAPDETRYLVVEMGARGIGHIAYLTQMVPPDVAVVLNVGVAHAGEFGSREATAQAKGELVEALGTGGLAVLNADDGLVAAMASRAAGQVMLFGRSAHAQVRAENVTVDGAGRARFTLRTPAGSAAVGLRLLGEHHVANALAAAAAAHGLGLETTQIADALSSAQAISAGRMQLVRLPGGVSVIDDAYNANPDSTAAGLRALAAVETSGRRIAVLGEMRELGAHADAAHRAAGELAAALGIDVVVGVGGQAADLVTAGARSGGAATCVAVDRREAVELLTGLAANGDVVLVKASAGARLQGMAAELDAAMPVGGLAGAPGPG